MQFDSLTFILFFLAVLGLYYALPGWGARKTLLLAASYLFYAAWNPLFIFLIGFSTWVDWHAARHISRAVTKASRRAWLLVSLCANLGLLGWFKYANFLLGSFNDLIAFTGIVYRAPALDIVLPVGISFYTFQTLSYTIDVYRGRIGTCGSLRDFALFVAFFPQLVAGPIVRAAHFLPQTLAAKRFDWEAMGRGWLLILIGLVQKVTLADAVFAPVVDRVYAGAADVGALEAWTAVFAYSGQIFFDFSGYSLVAIGAAACMGFDIPDNFRSPYGAAGFRDFWSRWHISLSTWFRDYLYIPLGGNRHGAVATHRNLAVTMLIAGLWHGASWMFVLWGGAHALFLVIERAADVPRRIAAGPRRRFNGILYGLLTFMLVSIVWILFRSPDMDTARHMFAALTRTAAFPVLTDRQILLALAAAGGMAGFHALARNRTGMDIITRLPWWAVSLLATALVLLLFFTTGGDERAFIYFQF